MFVVERLQSVLKQVLRANFWSVASVSHGKAMTALRLKPYRLLLLVMVKLVMYALLELSVSRTFPMSAWRMSTVYCQPWTFCLSNSLVG